MSDRKPRSSVSYNQTVGYSHQHINQKHYPNHPKSYQNANSRKFSIEGESKQILPILTVNNSGILLLDSNNTNSHIQHYPSAKKTSLIIPPNLNSVQKASSDCDVHKTTSVEIIEDHTVCRKTENELLQQITNLKSEKEKLESEIKKIVSEIETLKSEMEILVKTTIGLHEEISENGRRYSILQQTYDNSIEKFHESEEKWSIEKRELERQLNEIRREYEQKISDIRKKHSEEIHDLEEKLRIMKIRLADTLNIRSEERQFEIDRLISELDKSRANEEYLRAQIKKMNFDIK